MVWSGASAACAAQTLPASNTASSSAPVRRTMYIIVTGVCEDTGLSTFARKHCSVEYQLLGRTQLRISRLGFGCGNIGGLMVRGTAADQERAVARAVELGMTYFDTAPMYGNGESATTLGRVLSVLKPDIVLATKTPADPQQRGRLGAAIAAS